MELKLSLADWLLYYFVPTKLEFIQPNFSHNLIQISKWPNLQILDNLSSTFNERKIGAQSV